MCKKAHEGQHEGERKTEDLSDDEVEWSALVDQCSA